LTAKPNTVLVPRLGNLSLLRASDTKQAWGLNLLLYGSPGAGKTTLCATAQDSPFGADVLFLDVEGGTRSISDRPDIAVYRPTKWEDLREVYESLKAGEHSFKTVVVDSLTEAQKMAMRAVIGNAPTPDRQQWGFINEKLTGLVRAFKDLTSTHQINAVFTALVKEEKDVLTGGVMARPAMTPGSSLDITAAVDNVGYLTKDDKGKRILYLDGQKGFLAKTREPVKHRLLPNAFEDPTLVDVLAALRSGPAQEEAA
jgi:hypothetical protein